MAQSTAKLDAEVALRRQELRARVEQLKERAATDLRTMLLATRATLERYRARVQRSPMLPALRSATGSNIPPARPVLPRAPEQHEAAVIPQDEAASLTSTELKKAA